LSAVAGSVVGLSLILLHRHDREKPIPYGPYLAIAGWIALMWGSDITEYYLRFSGL
jgi:leader peptidase (prepilin peptidase)/N-methyltransferase